MPKDYYLVLGISADSTQREIKAAYRRLAKEYHPDRCSDGEVSFLVIHEAYSVLHDPDRRREYDEDRRRTERRGADRRFCPSSADVVEPLVPEGHAVFRRGTPAGPRSGETEGASLFSHVFGGSWRDEPDQGSRGMRPLEVVLTPQQALRGGILRLLLPVQVPCRVCGGRGGSGFITCFRCRGTGVECLELPLRLEYPPGIADNATLRVGLDGFGLNAGLTLRFRVRC